MTIRTKPADVPTDLPPAKLYLDDIAEIVQIFSEALPSQQDSYGGVPPIITKFEVGRKECDDIEELPKITKTTTNFNLEVSRGRNDASLHVYPTGTFWSWSGLDEAAWTAARELQSVFQQRQRPVRSLRDRLSYAPIILGLLVSLVFLLHNPKIEIAVFLAFLALLLVWYRASSRHTIVVLRYRHDQAALREGKTEKLTLIAVTATVSFLTFLVGQYFVHRWWPHP